VRIKERAHRWLCLAESMVRAHLRSGRQQIDRRRHALIVAAALLLRPVGRQDAMRNASRGCRRVRDCHRRRRRHRRRLTSTSERRNLLAAHSVEVPVPQMLKSRRRRRR